MFTLSFLLINLVITTFAPNDIYMNCPHVTLGCTKSRLCHVVFISTCSFFYPFCSFLSLLYMHCLFPLFACTSRVRQHSALSAVSWRFDLRGAANTQQLWRQNFCSSGTSPVELFHFFQSSCLIPTSRMDCSDDSWRDTFSGRWTRRSVTSDMRRHRKTLTYLPNTYLLTFVTWH